MEKLASNRQTMTDIKSARAFGILLGFSCFCLAIWLYDPQSKNYMAPMVAGACNFFFLWIRPQFFSLPSRIWLQVAKLLSRVFQPVFFTLIFLFVITPIALAYRSLGHEFLYLKQNSSCDTFWKSIPDKQKATDLKKQF